MPTRNRLTVALTFKQFLSAVLLRIFPIQNLEPSAAFSLCDVRPKLLFGNDAFQIQFADSLKQRSSRTVCVIRISQRKRGRGLCEQPPKLLFAVYQALSPQIFSVTDQQIECKEARRVLTAKQQIFNCGLRRLSSEQISPSMTTLAFGRESEIDSANEEKEANGCPLRESN